MKHINHTARLLLLTVLVCVLLVATVTASNNDLVWVTLTEVSGGATAQIVTDAAVTDGVVVLTYDSSILAYESVEVTEDYVAMYAVNASEDGTVRISWVAPGPYEVDSAGVNLIQVQFSGDAASATVSLSGSAHDAGGKAVLVKGEATVESPAEPTETKPEPAEPAPTETNPSEPAPAETEPVEAEPTEPSLTETEPVEIEPVETEPVETDPIDTEPIDTEPADTEPAETVPAQTVPEASESNDSDTPKTGDGFVMELLIGVMVCSAAAVAVVTGLYKRRGNR